MAESQDPKVVSTLPVGEKSSDAAKPARLRLVVLGDETLDAYPLPEQGDVTIGRIPENDVCINHPGVSRRHAVLSIGPPLALADLGSANGTTLRGERLKPEQPACLQPGDLFEIGSALIVIQGLPSVGRPRRLWSHGYFEGRLEDECARSERMAPGFSVLRLHVGGAVPPEDVARALAAAVRPADVLASYGPGEYEVLLPTTTAAQAETLAERLAVSLGERGLSVRTGVACYPRDGRSPEALVARACAAVQGGEAPEPEGQPIVLEDPAMKQLVQLVGRVAATPIHVLLLGETGVGKEVFAEKLHRLSARAPRPLVRLNCGALPESLLESELFGHERGAFTGAVRAKLGLLETAQGGTVFLDEVGEMPASAQVKLLRVIEEQQVLRVGGLRPQPIDVRFVAASNRDLEAEVARGTFRQDLFFRLNGITLIIPPLRERVVEIEPLARAFLSHACRRFRHPTEPGITPEALLLLESYGWPGNVRELRNVIERAVVLCADGPIRPEHLPVDKMRTMVLAALAPGGDPRPAGARATGPSGGIPTIPLPPAKGAQPAGDGGSPGGDLRAETEAHERRRILEALEYCAGNQTKAAELLGMPRRTLVKRLEEYQLPRPRKGSPPTR